MEKIKEIRELYEEHNYWKIQADLAKKAKVTPSLINQIIRHEVRPYKDIKGQATKNAINVILRELRELSKQ